MIRVYLDTCCFCRPLDDQEQLRVRLETEAILQVFGHIDRGLWTLVGSDVLNGEILGIRDPDQRKEVEGLAGAATEHIRTDPDLLQRAQVLESMGFDVYDSMHIASAEAAGADVLLTTDDALTRRARRVQQELGVHITNPLTWLKE